jgi:phosphatidylethanolamine-binding protein (PEBP) family uncharacterized protein
MKKAWWLLAGAFVIGGLSMGACSSSSGTSGTGGNVGTGGKAGSGGGSGGAAGGAAAAGGSGGAAGGATATGGSGGAAATGGSGGGAGAGGSAGVGGIGGGVGGAAGAGCTAGAPPVTPHDSCTDIPSVKQGGGAGAGGAGGAGGAAGFTISSPDFAYCGAFPAGMTCDGHAFGTGTNPNLTWSGAPTGTMSYAIVFKDISLLADTTSSTAETDINIQHGYHWAMWDIPAATTHLSTGSMTGYHSADISGALQWSQRNNYGYFPPEPVPQGRRALQLQPDPGQLLVHALRVPVRSPAGPPGARSERERRADRQLRVETGALHRVALGSGRHRVPRHLLGVGVGIQPPGGGRVPLRSRLRGRRRNQAGRRRQAGWQHRHVSAVTAAIPRSDIHDSLTLPMAAG